jgi:hypothetical protein
VDTPQYITSPVRRLRKTPYAAVTLCMVIVAGVQSAAERRWQMGMCTQVGIKRTPFVSDVVHERLPRASTSHR